MLQGYRTYIVAGLVAMFGVMATFDWISIFNDPRAGLVALGSAVVMAVLRAVTTTPAGKTEEQVKEELKAQLLAEQEKQEPK